MPRIPEFTMQGYTIIYNVLEAIRPLIDKPGVLTFDVSEELLPAISERLDIFYGNRAENLEFTHSRGKLYVRRKYRQ